MTTADQINAQTSLEAIAHFLKFAPAGQFRLLTREQVEIIEPRLEEAYEKISDVENQR